MENDKTIIIQSDNDSDEENFNLSGLTDFFHLCLGNWKWFVVSLAICLGLAFIYLGKTAPKYTRSASVHIKEDSRNSSISSISDEIANLGMGSSAGSVKNEVVAFNSLELAERVVQQLNLNVNYTTRKGLRRTPLFGSNLPLNVSFPELDNETALLMNVQLLPSGKILVEDIEFQDDETSLNQEVAFGDTLSTVAGLVIFSQTFAFKLPEQPLSIRISRTPISVATTVLHAKLTAEQNDIKNSVVDISCTDESIERAEAIINTLIIEYNKSWMKDKNEICVMTSQFINDRISVIERELGGVDSDIADYKSSNLITDPVQAASMFMAQANESDQQLLTLSNQVYMCRYLRDYIANTGNVNKLIPANIGIKSADVNLLIENFNQTMLMRNTYVRNSSDKNPMVQNLDEELAAQRSVILQSLDNEQKGLEVQIAASKKTIEDSRSVLSSSPVKQRNLLSMDRQQKIKEALYLFLLQKREENELSQAFTAYNTRIISRPMGPNTPTAPKSTLILALALLAALIIPVLVLYFRELFYTKVRGRADIESMSAPFIGEIPEHREYENKKNWLKRFKKSNVTSELKLLVEHDRHDDINEAFRIVRSNLNFILRPNSETYRQVLLVTSAMPSSGKSFVSLNLSAVFALQKNTRVAIIDLDIRKATLSNYFGKPKTGITDYLGGFEDDWHSILLHQNNVDILPVGHFPPNPAELLQSDRLASLINEMRKEYNLIILDMPPVEIVADVTIVKHLADVTLFVVRVGVMERAMLPSIENYYKNLTFNNLSLILNSSDSHNSRYGHYGYGYGYGHKYGYGK